MPVYAMILEYDGTEFYGFQLQKEFEPTVQGNLEKAVQVVCKEKTRISCAGRTDTGVHAKGMVVSFSISTEISNFRKFMLSMNALSSEKVSVLCAAKMPDEFHARFSCTEREYEYLIVNSKSPSPLFEKKALWINSHLNLDKMRADSKELLGKKDFSSLAKKSSLHGKSAERQIHSITIEESKESPGLIRFRICGSGFLHNMVRITIGTLIDIGRGKLNGNILAILESKDRALAGKTLPPYGLYFLRAGYKDYPQIENLYRESKALP